MTGVELTLYYSPGACSLAAHIALREAGIDFKLERRTIKAREHLQPGYLAINPRGRVPTLLVDGKPVRELSAILSWICEINPTVAPPRGSYASAQCREWLAYFTSTIHITFAQIWRGERFLRDPSLHTILRIEGSRILGSQFAEVEAALSKSRYLAGDDYCVADANALVFYRWGWRVGFDMEAQFPNWTRHARSLLDRPAVHEALEAEGLDMRPAREPALAEHAFTAEALAEFDAAWTAQDIDALLRHMHPDSVYAASVGQEPGQTYRGAEVGEGFRKMLAFDASRARRSGRTWFLGDVAFAEWSFVDHTAQGTPRTIRGIDLFEFEDGRIKLKDAYRKSYPPN